MRSSELATTTIFQLRDHDAYGINVLHHLIHWRLDGVAYWTAAAAITAAVTWQNELRSL